MERLSAKPAPLAAADQLRLARRRSFLQFNIDCAIWLLVIVAAAVLRFEYAVQEVEWLPIAILGVIAGVLHTGAGYFFRLHSGRFPYGSFEEVRTLTFAVLLESVILTIGVIVIGPTFGIPRGLVLIAFPLALVLMFGVRYLRRLSLEHARKPRLAATAVVVGAGHTGDLIVRSMMTDPGSPLRPVALLDDDPVKRRLQLQGVPVMGGLNDLENVARATGAEVAVIAIATADAAMVRRLTDTAIAAGLRVLVIPAVRELVSGSVSVADLRQVKIEDLLGRTTVDTRIEDIAGYVTGRRVLVTGAGGSIGSELCLQLSKFGPSELIMLDRDETGLQHAQLGTAGHGLLDTREVVLADIRDAGQLLRIFAERKPEVVFHAAALKHLPMLEQYPDEAWKTNVLGTLNVVNAARSVGVTTFVNISTDKAANPTSVLGHSKRVAEKITSWAGDESGHRYLSVRFGNVIGSRGSMLPTFQKLIASGGPVTVTHPDATRYFMTIPEACQLVVQAGGIGRAGEVLILDMGEPVRILDVARRMIAMSGKKIEIVFTGLRDGEKLHEELVGDRENLERPFHPKVSHTRAEPIDPALLDKEAWKARMNAEPRINDTSAIDVQELGGCSLG
nr:nucleoside-diphosphate sugar epimerase/dehydratase [Paenarthrobacter ureafaciens]